jgi:hypothetical protein
MRGKMNEHISEKGVKKGNSGCETVSEKTSEKSSAIFQVGI